MIGASSGEARKFQRSRLDASAGDSDAASSARARERPAATAWRRESGDRWPTREVAEIQRPVAEEGDVRRVGRLDMRTGIPGRLLYIDWDLRAFCESTGLRNSNAGRRMNAIVNVATRATEPWRVGRFDLMQHIRYATSTQPELLDWICEVDGCACTDPRISVYRSSLLIDDRLPHGRLRIMI